MENSTLCLLTTSLAFPFSVVRFFFQLKSVFKVISFLITIDLATKGNLNPSTALNAQLMLPLSPWLVALVIRSKETLSVVVSVSLQLYDRVVCTLLIQLPRQLNSGENEVVLDLESGSVQPIGPSPFT